MDEAKVKELKRQVQASAVEVARKFYEIDRAETGGGRCGACHPCQESMANIAKLFFKAMERELSALFDAEKARTEPSPHRHAYDPEFYRPKDNLN